MDFLRSVFSWGTMRPLLIVGASITAVTSFYNGQLIGGLNPSSTVNNIVAKALSMVKLDTGSGVGKYIGYAVHFIITGVLVTASLYGAARLMLLSPV